MRRLAAAALVAAVLAVPAAGAPGSGEAGAQTKVRPEPTGSILIEGDDELAEHPAVRGGSGTADDPYVISDYAITRTQPTGLALADTSDHVRIEHVAVVACANPFCGTEAIVALEDVSNVTVRDVYLTTRGSALQVLDSEHVDMDRLRFARTTTAPTGGLLVGDSRNVHVANLSVDPLRNEFAASASDHVTVESSTFTGERTQENFLDFRRGSNLTVDRVAFEHVHPVWEPTPAENWTFRDSTFNDSRFDSVGRDSHEFDGLAVCGNTFRGTHDLPSLWIRNPQDVDIAGNLFVDEQQSVQAEGGDDIEIRQNRFRNATLNALTLDVPGAMAKNNSFEDVGEPSDTVLPTDRGVVATDEADVRFNWWDDPSGPSGEGNGSGEPLHVLGDAEVAYEPWLTSRPNNVGPQAVDCGGPGGPSGAQAEPRIDVGAYLEAELTAPAPASLEAGGSAMVEEVPILDPRPRTLAPTPPHVLG